MLINLLLQTSKESDEQPSDAKSHDKTALQTPKVHVHSKAVRCSSRARNISYLKKQAAWSAHVPVSFRMTREARNSHLQFDPSTVRQQKGRNFSKSTEIAEQTLFREDEPQEPNGRLRIQLIH